MQAQDDVAQTDVDADVVDAVVEGAAVDGAADQAPEAVDNPVDDAVEAPVADAGLRPRPRHASAARVKELEAEGEVAADYLEGLLDIADLDGDIDMDVEGDRAMVSIVGGDLDDLVGDDGKVLDALQELTRLAVTRETGERSRLMLDVAGFRAARREALTALGTEAAGRASSTGEPVRLEPMTPFERKVVHDAVAAAGLTSESEGEEPKRYVVVLPQA